MLLCDGTNKMNKLDKAILDWIGENNDNDLLSQQLAAAAVARRDYMKTGFFIYLRLSGDLPRLADGFRPRCPDIQAAGLIDGAGTTLFLRDGRLHYLEIYARGGFFPPELSDFELLPPAT